MMKYMGSKRAMLQNGLGHLLDREAPLSSRFVDLFSGSGSVALHVACKQNIPVLAGDLQRFCVTLLNAVISRQAPIDLTLEWHKWRERAERVAGQVPVPTYRTLNPKCVNHVRQWAEAQSEFPITLAYGGHYFSATQSIYLDALRVTMPRDKRKRTVALAALIWAASRCAASPGHTAQPFQPTKSGLQFISEAWDRDAVSLVGDAFCRFGRMFALKPGSATVGDANRLAASLKPGDLAFVDPPYSAVHYSRFYHVLETIAVGYQGPVIGRGRYPPIGARPRSRYSVVTESEDALDELLSTIASRGARAIVTFPAETCSNGLSGEAVREIAAEHFRVKSNTLEGRFSTLGGNGKKRSARTDCSELVLVLEPK